MRAQKGGQVPRQMIPMLGLKFGTLTVLKRSYVWTGEVSWLCKCECGNRVVRGGVALRQGVTHSCGCKTRRGRPKDRLARVQES